MTIHTKRRKRRRAKAKLKHGSKAVRRHARIAGRTGAIQEKKTPSSKRLNYKRTIPNTFHFGCGWSEMI